MSQRATIYLGTIHDTALHCLRGCLEDQLDTVPEDRPVILKNLFQLFNTLADRNILTWEFFANRFECIINEIQETKQVRAEDPEATPNPNHTAANGTREARVEARVARGRQRSGTDSVRSLVQGAAHPYKRTYSAPAGIVHTLHTKVAFNPTRDFKKLFF